MSDTLLGQKNGLFLGLSFRFTLLGQKNSPFLGRGFRPTYDAADRLVRVTRMPNKKPMKPGFTGSLDLHL